MNANRTFKSALVVAGVVVLFYFGYGVINPPRIKARAQRITPLNAAPRQLTFTVSNTPVPASTLPNTGK